MSSQHAVVKTQVLHHPKLTCVRSDSEKRIVPLEGKADAPKKECKSSFKPRMIEREGIKCFILNQYGKVHEAS